jgi:RHS repeat-associated protein
VYDGTAADELVQRYYTSTLGRFMTPDPYMGNSGGPGDPNYPLSWNRYAYTAADPVNATDPQGTTYCFVNPSTGLTEECYDSVDVYGSAGALGGGGSHGGGGGSVDLTPTEKGAKSPGNYSIVSFLAQVQQFLKNTEATACKGLPDGMVISLSGTLAAALGGTASGEAVFNFNTGEISLFGSLGFTEGFVFPGANLQTGFIWGLGQSNSSFSGAFTSVSIGAGVIGGALAGSSNGLQNPFNVSAPLVASVGAQTPGVTYAYGTSYYSNAVGVGNLNNLAYQLLFPQLYQYMQDYQSLCGPK